MQHVPTIAELRELESRGLRVLSLAPPDGVTVGLVGAEASLAGLAVRSIEKRDAAQRLSPRLDRKQPRWTALVEFEPDVTESQMQTLQAAAGLRLLPKRGLLARQRVYEGGPKQFERLAAEDGVASVIPASDDLIRNEEAASCGGGVVVLDGGSASPAASAEATLARLESLAAAIPVVPYAATYGDGWDGPGRNAATISYTFGAINWKLSNAYVRRELLRAMAEWAKYVQIGFWENTRRDAKRNIDISFAGGNHGDSLNFQAGGPELAHTFYPAPPNPESIAGDLHINTDLSWEENGNPDLFALVLHELGHALGLGHSDDPQAVMYPVYRRGQQLNTWDINAIRSLYAMRQELTVQPADAPTSGVTQDLLDLSGFSDGGVGDVTVTWNLGANASGTAQGGRYWQISSIPLEVGNNTIAITARDSIGSTATTTVTVERMADAAPPTVVITNPGSGRDPVGGGGSSQAQKQRVK